MKICLNNFLVVREYWSRSFVHDGKVLRMDVPVVINTAVLAAFLLLLAVWQCVITISRG